MAANNAAQPTAASTWTEPPWSGWIETTGDALLILEAARRGLIPRVTRRLVDSERKMITSGSVFVFDEDESGIKRWTDGFFWSPSRILGNFLLYRETDKRGAGHRGVRSDPPPTSEVNEHSYNVDGVKLEGQTLSRPKGETSQMGIDKHRERTLMGSLTNSYKFKPEGLMKKTFSLTIGGVSQHLISYYKIEDVENGRLRCPSALPELASLEISPEYLDKVHFRNPPKVEIGVDGLPRYRGEADIEEDSPTMLSAPLSSDVPLLKSVNELAGAKRAKRYDPYGTGAGKRPRKNKTNAQEEGSSPTESTPISASTSAPQPLGNPTQQQHPQQPAYPTTTSAVDHGSIPATMTHPQYSPYGMPYYQMSAYPPPPHMYSSPQYPQQTTTSPSVSPTSATQPQHQQQTSPPPSQTTSPSQSQQYSAYTYTPPPPPPHTAATSTDSQQVIQQQPYQYPYYPPPHTYPTYPPGVAWTYPGYPPQQHQQQIVHQPATTSPSDLGEKPDGRSVDDVENGQA